MPDNQLPLFRMPEPTLRHLNIPNNPDSVNFAGSRSFGKALRDVPRAQHAAALRRQLDLVDVSIVAIQQQQIERNLPEQVDLILELESAPEFPLSAEHIHSLTTGSKITLLNARSVSTDAGEVTRVALHVPYGSLPELSEKVRRYGEETTDRGNVPNPWVANLQRIAIAALEALWTDPDPLPAVEELFWWEFWVRRDQQVLASFDRLVGDLEIQVKGKNLTLPEHVVVVAKMTRARLESSLDLLNTLAEVRKARPCNLGLSDLPEPEQQEWIDEALARLQLPGPDAPAVCVLDSGINRGHALLSPLLADDDNKTVFPDGDRSDSWSGTGHGTLMAGLAAYGDLRNLMFSTQNWLQTHRLEGCKIFDPSQPHEPDNYGAITLQGIVLPETTAPKRNRAYTLAITADSPCDGRPSAWSAAVDAAAFGAEEDGEPKRLVIVSTGNVDALGLGTSFSYPVDNENAPVQDPAQAWNAVTVGALTHFNQIRENDPESSLLQPIAPDGGLSPFSCTANSWDTHWPLKPEIVMEGGNAGMHPQFGPERRDSLDLLSTSASFRIRSISPMRATSAATALAGRLAGQLHALYPTYWPETIRGLLIHSARWNKVMLNGLDPFRAPKKGGRSGLIRILRSFGFGEPKIQRAHHSSEQEVTLLREDTITPYRGSAGSASLNHCHIHHLGLPAESLRQQGGATCTMRVTLSYFTAPNPSASNRISGSRYRYGGCLLRFRVRHKDEDADAFERQVSSEAAKADEPDDETENLNDRAWALGTKLRGKAGSIVQDIWQGSAADLAQMDRIAIYPVKGWWASRSFRRGSNWHRCHLRPIRYSLLVSLEVTADIPLYTEIRNILQIPVELDA